MAEKKKKQNISKKEEKESEIQQVVNHFFYSKGLSIEQIKEDAKKKKIIYGRFAKPAKQLIELSGSVNEAKNAIDKVAQWANSRNLDYSIETIFKKWLELDKLKPKEIVKKPYYKGDPMIWSDAKKKWYVVTSESEWLEYCGKESEIQCKTK